MGQSARPPIILTADELARQTEQESQAFKTFDDLSNSNAAAFNIVKNFGGGIARAPIAGRSLAFPPTLSAVEVSLRTSSLAAASRCLLTRPPSRTTP